MINLGHGANVEDMCKYYKKNSKDIIDFSSNINPYIIDDLEKYLIDGFRECIKYPDINYTRLKRNIASYLDIESSYIIPGNGATEIIYLLMKSIKKRLALLNPTFSEYERSAKIAGLDTINLYLDKDNDFKIDIENIKENIDKFDSLFICNPSNPIGKVYELNNLIKLLNEHKKLLIVDETFMEFVEREEEYSLVNLVERNKNIFIIKAATKFFGMPGLRLGYGVCSDKELLENMYNLKEPWSINSFADNLSNYIFKNKDYIKSSKDFYIKERKFMLESLKKISNIKVFETDTNFILIKLKNKKSYELKEEIFIRGNILIRDASNFRNLDDSYIRIAIKSHDENIKILKILNKILGE